MQHTRRLLTLSVLLLSAACGGRGIIGNGDPGGGISTGGTTSGGAQGAATSTTGASTGLGGAGGSTTGTTGTTVTTDSNDSSGVVTTVSGRESWVWVYVDYATSLNTITANPNAFTHVSPTFYSLNYNYTSGVAYYANCPTSTNFNCASNGTNNFDNMTTAQFTSKVKALGMQVIPAIYAGAANGGSDTAVQSILNNTSNAGTNFINAMVTEAVNNGYGGYNLDWEVGSSTGSAYADKFVSFVNTFKTALSAHGMSLSVDAIASNVNGTWCSGNDGYLDFAKLSKSTIDRIIIEDYTSSLGTATTSCQPVTLSTTSPASCPLNSNGSDVNAVGLYNFMCGNLPTSMVVIGFESYSSGSNPIAGSAMSTAKSYGFNKVAVWPQAETGYPFLSSKSLVAPQGNWYAMLESFLQP